MIRWMFLLRYPEGVSMEEGERWYLGTHTQEAKRMKGLVRYRSWKLDTAPERVADEGNPARNLERLNRWHRMTELGFSSWEASRERVIDHPQDYTPPPYGPPGFHSETIFIGDRPDYDFLREVPEV